MRSNLNKLQKHSAKIWKNRINIPLRIMSYGENERHYHERNALENKTITKCVNCFWSFLSEWFSLLFFIFTLVRSFVRSLFVVLSHLKQMRMQHMVHGYKQFTKRDIILHTVTNSETTTVGNLIFGDNMYVFFFILHFYITVLFSAGVICSQ